MKCAIPTIDEALLDISKSAEIGVETKLLYSNDPVRELGEIVQDDVDDGTYTPDKTYTAISAGRDLQVVCLDSVQSDEQIVIALGVTLDNGATGSGIATIKPSATAIDDSYNLPAGIAVDVQLFVSGTDVSTARKVRTVDSLISVDGGAAGNKFAVISCPEKASYVTVACVTNRDVEVPTAKSVPIECGYDGARWVKRGRSTPPKLDIKANYSGFGDGLPRINGQRVTVMMETRKDDKVLTERMIIGGYRPEVKIAKPDGDAKAEASATGMFESGKFAVFC